MQKLNNNAEIKIRNYCFGVLISIKGHSRGAYTKWKIQDQLPLKNSRIVPPTKIGKLKFEFKTRDEKFNR